MNTWRWRQWWKIHKPQSYCVLVVGGCSDHMRCMIKILSDQMKPRRPFKFINALVKTAGFLPTVEIFWNDTEHLFLSSFALHRFTKKLTKGFDRLEMLPIKLRKLLTDYASAKLTRRRLLWMRNRGLWKDGIKKKLCPKKLKYIGWVWGERIISSSIKH